MARTLRANHGYLPVRKGLWTSLAVRVAGSHCAVETALVDDLADRDASAPTLWDTQAGMTAPERTIIRALWRPLWQ